MFKLDLNEGRKAEKLVQWLFNRSGLPTKLAEAGNPYYDLITKDFYIEFTTEVKLDKKEADTGRIALEIYNSNLGKESGIAGTKSTFWAHVLKDSVWLIQTASLVEWINDNEADYVFRRAGDGNADILLYSTGYILSESGFQRIDKMSKKRLKEFIYESCS